MNFSPYSLLALDLTISSHVTMNVAVFLTTSSSLTISSTRHYRERRRIPCQLDLTISSHVTMNVAVFSTSSTSLSLLTSL
ncbi:hypothetical protein RRG08_000838 [Elysia crispata]|uniref:Uncharacterized protein n=1 Tax=Elysia crispata TaxID=231223 RepID=A0AAE0Z6C8_9GAST|nr:hypothetical protein RRG08_000838 [Elysia crispata]